MRKEIAVFASGVSLTFTGALTAINLNNNLNSSNNVECSGETEWETAWDSPHGFRVAIWPGRIQITKNANTGVENLVFERSPLIDRSVWDNLDLALCEIDEGGWLLFTKSGPTIILNDLISPRNLVMLSEESAYYWTPKVENREYGMSRFDDMEFTDINLITGEIRAHDRG